MRRRNLTGGYAMRPAVQVVGGLAAAVVLGLNGLLLMQAFGLAL